MNKKAPVGILGGGITGLCVAYGLHKKGIEAMVYEKNDTPGGVIQSTCTDGWLIEHGPNTLMVRRQKVWDLLSELQLDDQIKRTGTESAKRFIVKNGKLVPIPLSLTGFVKTNLFSASAKLRLLKEPFVPASDREDESISRFISRRLGREPLEYAADPFVSGVYAGDPGRLSVRHTFSSLWEMEQTYGSLLKAVFRKNRSGSKTERVLISFGEGMQTLPRALQHRLGNSVQCNTEVQGLTRTPEGWKVKTRSPEGLTEQRHEVIISTVPAYSLHRVFGPEWNQPEVDRISRIPYAPLSVISLGFRRDQVDHPLDGFGMLIPEAESFQTLGTLFSSSLFSNRASNGHVLLTSFIGGARKPELACKPTKELLTIVVQELSQLLHIKGPSVFSEHICWKQAIPQYEVGYEKYLSAMERLESQSPGLFLAGNYRRGVSVPDCIENGIETARRAVMFLSS